MTRVLPVVVAIILAVYALIDCLQTDSSRFRYLNKPSWAFIVVLLPVIGPILWLILGKRRAQSKPVRRPAAAPLPPDDNPEFLRELHNLDAEHEKLLSDWEESLRRREQDLRKDDDPPARDEKQKPQKPRRAEDAAEEELGGKNRSDGGEDDPR